MSHPNQESSNPAIEVVKTISNKEAPSNQQIEALVDASQHVLEKQKIHSDSTSAETVSDFQEVLEATKQLMQNKNFDESMQTAILEAGTAAKETGQTGKQKLSSDSTKQLAHQHSTTVKEHGKNIVTCVWDVLRMMIKSGDFRSHVNNLLGILQDLLSAGQDQTEEERKNMAFRGKISEEKKQQLISSFLSLLRQFNERPQFQQGLREISHIFEELDEKRADPQLKKMATEMTTNQHLNETFDKSKTLVERFSKRPIDPLLQKNKDLFQYVRTHEQARAWTKDLSYLLRDSIAHPDQINDVEFRQRTSKLIDQAQELSKDHELRLKYSELMTELRAIFQAIREDPDLKRLQLATAKFLDNFMTTDAQGNRHFNQDFITQLRQFIMPLLVGQLENIPIPPIVGSNEDYDYQIDNIVLHGKEILPEKIEIHTRNDLSLRVHEMSTEQSRTSAELAISNIRLTVSDFHFKFDKKTFPKLHDEGNATLKVEGNNGASLRMRIEMSMVNGAPRLSLRRVDFDIERLKINIEEARHDILLKLFSSIYQTRVKTMIEQKTEEKIREVFQKIEAGMNDLFARYPPSKLKEMVKDKVSSSTDSSSMNPVHVLQS